MGQGLETQSPAGGAGMLGQLAGLTTTEKPVLGPHMRLFSRPEVWFLVLASAIAAWWALREPEPYAADASEAAASMGEDAVLRIQRCTLTRDFGNARLDIEFRFRNTAPRPLFMQPPDVRLLSSDGREVPPFILPAERPPRVAEKASADLRLRFWLEKEHLGAGLRLDVRGHSAEVKSQAPFDLEKLKNDVPKVWTTSNWK
jgi:hypothetical protein